MNQAEINNHFSRDIAESAYLCKKCDFRMEFSKLNADLLLQHLSTKHGISPEFISRPGRSPSIEVKTDGIDIKSESVDKTKVNNHSESSQDSRRKRGRPPKLTANARPSKLSPRPSLSSSLPISNSTTLTPTQSQGSLSSSPTLPLTPQQSIASSTSITSTQTSSLISTPSMIAPIPASPIPVKSENYLQAVTLYMAYACLPPNEINNVVFKSFCTSINSQIISSIPTENEILKNINTIATKIRSNIVDSLSKTCLFCSLTLETILLHTGNSVLQITAHWISDNFEYQTAVIGAKVYTQNNQQSLKAIIKSILDPYPELVSKIVGIITPTNHRITHTLQALQNENYIPPYCVVIICFIDVLNTILLNAFSYLYDTNNSYTNGNNVSNKFSSTFLSPLKTLMGEFSSNPSLMARWKEKNQKPICLTGHDSWLNIYLLLFNIEIQWNDLCEFLKDNLSEETVSNFFNKNVHTEIQEVLKLLSPLYEIIQYLQTQQILTIGAVYPFLRTYANFLLIDQLDTVSNGSLPTTQLAIEIRKLFHSSFAAYWTTIPTKSVGLATILDPRYRSTNIFNDAEKKLLQNILIEDIFTLQKSFHPVPNEKGNDPASIINYYMKHDVPQQSIDVLGWWKKNHSKFNELTYYFKMYYCIPCVSGSKDLLLHEFKPSFYTNRYNLTEEIAEPYIMIRSNMMFNN